MLYRRLHRASWGAAVLESATGTESMWTLALSVMTQCYPTGLAFCAKAKTPEAVERWGLVHSRKLDGPGRPLRLVIHTKCYLTVGGRPPTPADIAVRNSKAHCAEICHSLDLGLD
jgi:hypothetical protein